jgi:hypothetical protein
MTDIFVTANEIVDIIQILDLNKASGPDKISHKMLKIAPEKIAEPLQIIFNKSLRQGKYPSSWKMAHVIAILRKGDTSLPSNYRPMKALEKSQNKKQLNSFFSSELSIALYSSNNWWIVECFGRRPD